MTREDVEHYTQEIKDAVKSGDRSRVQCAHARILVSMMDCQAKTADRVKEMYTVVTDIKRDHTAMFQSHQQYQTERAERRGAQKMLTLLKYLAVIGGSGTLGALLKAMAAGG